MDQSYEKLAREIERLKLFVFVMFIALMIQFMGLAIYVYATRHVQPDWAVPEWKSHAESKHLEQAERLEPSYVAFRLRQGRTTIGTPSTIRGAVVHSYRLRWKETVKFSIAANVLDHRLIS